MSITNFEWKNPTHLIIKADASPEIADHIAAAGIKKVLLLMGQASVKKIGLFDKVAAALKAKNIEFVEFSGVRANPEIKTVCKAIDICREQKIEAILPLGGGSVFDSAKGIAVGATFPKDVPAQKIWEVYEFKRTVTAALPIYGVLTISATGSEQDSGSVVQDDEQKKKWFFMDPHVFPVVSIVDPKIQQSLPWYQQVNGFVDAIMHVCEHLTGPAITDPELVETSYAIDISLVRSIIKCGNKLKANNEDYNARANFVWAAACALNGVSGMAIEMCGVVHMLEHAMGAMDPRISHGAGLGVAFPAFVKANAEKGRLLNLYDRMAKEIFGKQGWKGLIEGWTQMLKHWGHPTTLNELFNRTVTDAERDELARICAMHPGGAKGGELVRIAYGYM